MELKYTNHKVMSRSECIEKYCTLLTEEGFHFRVDDDGDIIFKYEGKAYIILVDEDDVEFHHIVCPNFWHIDSEQERNMAKDAALHASYNTKVAKVIPYGDNVSASAELFFPPEVFEAYDVVFRRCLAALQTAVKKFVEEMRD